MKRTPIRQRSAKKAVEVRARIKFLLKLERDRGPICQAQGAASPACQGFWSDGHELVRRSQGGDPLSADNVILVCRLCHDWIGANPALAIERGLAKRGLGL